MIKKIDANEFHTVIKNSRVSVVDFSAEWCGPCQMLAPIMKKLSETINSADFYSVDIDEQNELAAEYKIEAVPSVLFFKDGKVVNESVGFRSENDLKATILAYSE